MTANIKIVKENNLHKGFLKLDNYEIQAPSFNPQIPHINLTREVLTSRDSVLVLIYVPTVDSFMLVQQFRTGVFINEHHNDDPFILECVAGMIDKNATPEQIACMEVYEETGIEVQSLQKIAATYRSPGLSTEKTYIFYTEIDHVPRCGLYGVEDEEIMTHLLRRKEVYTLMDEMKIQDTVTLLALNWFRVTHRG